MTFQNLLTKNRDLTPNCEGLDFKIQIMDEADWLELVLIEIG